MSKERLVELIGQAKSVEASGIDCEVTDEYIADHLLASGVIVPPCKVGDVVYYLHPMKDNRLLPFINTAKIKRIEITKKTTKLFYSENKYFVVTEFDKTVFLSKEKAEAKLKEDESK